MSACIRRCILAHYVGNGSDIFILMADATCLPRSVAPSAANIRWAQIKKTVTDEACHTP